MNDHMRYVRTEEGLIFDTQNADPFMVVDGYIDFNSLGRFKIKGEADTIEELFDCFVDYREEDDSHLVLPKEPISRRYGHEIYGAIWTDKGLIYVAKLYTKGKWEFKML